MSVIRVFHNKENPFTILSNEVLDDQTLSNSALGLWARCMRRPDGWVFHIAEIVKNGVHGKTAIYSQINELIEKGYCLRIQHRKKAEDNNRIVFESVDYVFFETKITEKMREEYEEKLKKCFPHSGFLLPEKPVPENAPLLNTYCLANTDNSVVCRETDSNETPVCPELGSVEPRPVVCRESAPVEPPPARTTAEEEAVPITIHGSGGESIRLTMSDLFSESVRVKADWDANEIRETWKILAEYRGVVQDWRRFVEGTIQNLRKRKAIDKLRKQNTLKPNRKKKECTTEKDTTKSNPLMKQSETTNSKPMTLVTWEQAYQKYLQEKKSSKLS